MPSGALQATNGHMDPSVNNESSRSMLFSDRRSRICLRIRPFFSCQLLVPKKRDAKLDIDPTFSHNSMVHASRTSIINSPYSIHSGSFFAI